LLTLLQANFVVNHSVLTVSHWLFVADSRRPVRAVNGQIGPGNQAFSLYQRPGEKLHASLAGSGLHCQADTAISTCADQYLKADSLIQRQTSDVPPR